MRTSFLIEFIQLCIGGGLGGTRRGGPDVNIKHSGREDNERERERYRLEREREDRSGGGAVSGGGGNVGGGGMDRRADFRDRGDRKLIQLYKMKVLNKLNYFFLILKDLTIVVDPVHRELIVEKENGLNIVADHEIAKSVEVGIVVTWMKLLIDVVIEVIVKRIRKENGHDHVIDLKESEIVVTEIGKEIRIAKTGSLIYVKVTSKLKRNQLMVSLLFFIYLFIYNFISKSPYQCQNSFESVEF